MASDFPGFPAETTRFLADLKANNNRDWFTAHRAAYEAAVRAPAEAFVAALTPQLEALNEGPVSAKIFRVHRDVRFSKDKTPYNAHLHIGFAVASASGRRCGFYFGLEPDRTHLGAGTFELPGPALDAYRAAVADEVDGMALTGLVGTLTAKGYTLNDPALKRTPAPYAADHPRGEFLRRKGLAAWHEVTDRRWVENPRLVDEVLGVFRDLAPLNRWLEDALEGVSG